jgi:glycosyltransferase involved in cell wall biosynthesis
MKILHLNSEKSWRGGEQQMANLALELKSQGHTNIIAARSGSDSIKFAKKNGFQYLELPIGGLKIRASLKLRNYLRANIVDLVHTHTANAHTIGVYANVLGAKTPLVVSKRTDFPVKSQFKFRHPSVKKILCVSNKIKEITEYSCQGLNNVHTVYSGINKDRFNGDQVNLKEVFNIAKDKVLVGNCSAIAPHKDYFTFIDTAKLLDSDKYHFIIIGDGPMENEIKAYAKGLDNITFTGFMPNIHEVLKSLDIFLITSEEEGLGTSILVARICEIPVVATRAGGIPEIAINNKTALTSAIKDPKDLAKNVKDILLVDNKHLPVNAKEMVLNSFTKEATAMNTLKHYKEVLEL